LELRRKRMTKAAQRLLLLGTVMVSSAGLAGEEAFPRLKGPYFGQEPPGLTPQLFAPGIIVNEDHEGSSGFALGGTVFVYQKVLDRRSHTYVTYLWDGYWTTPELIPFWETMVHNGDFVFSSDDKTMLYQVKTESGGELASDIWRVEVKPEGWGPRAPFPAPINTAYDESFAAEALNKNLYFFSRRPGGVGKSDLYRSTLESGDYADPVNLAPLNTEDHEWDPFVAPDESYLVFCSTRPGGMGMDDLYITFRDEDGSWSRPVNMGEAINSPRSENRPYVTLDGKYFFYTSSKSGNRDIYWVSAELLDRFRAVK
jgi:hypothetical protein